MAGNKRRKPKFNGPTPPERERRQIGHVDGGRRMQYYDPGRNPRPRNLEKQAGASRHRGGDR